MRQIIQSIMWGFCSFGLSLKVGAEVLQTTEYQVTSTPSSFEQTPKIGRDVIGEKIG